MSPLATIQHIVVVVVVVVVQSSLNTKSIAQNQDYNRT